MKGLLDMKYLDFNKRISLLKLLTHIYIHLTGKKFYTIISTFSETWLIWSSFLIILTLYTLTSINNPLHIPTFQCI